MMDLRVLKPVARTSGVIEIWNGELLLAKVFARHDGERHFHFSRKAAAWGPHWITLGNLASRVFELLDVADEEMRQARGSFRG